MHLANHRRENVAVDQVKIVVRPIEVCGHHGYVVSAILQVELLAKFQAGNFSDGVRFVSVFQWRSKQSVFGDRLGRFARVNTSGAQKKKVLHPMAPCFADYVLLDLEVLIDEVGTVHAVGHDAANVSGGQYYCVGLFEVEELAHGHAVEQVQFGMSASDYVGEAALLKVAHNGRPNQATVAGNVYF